ncbi:sensor histidine kinase [Microbacterium sp. P07]|uniref:sensor histidine kinase n=1 Tax=Microbacterium sp. P07 TaxID=3366952 RepID=UPI003746ED60
MTIHPNAAPSAVADPDDVDDADDRVTTILGTPRAALTFGAIIFVITSIQGLANPLALVIDGQAAWTLPLSLPTVIVLVTFGSAVQALALALSARRPLVGLLGTLACYLLLVIVVGVPLWLSGMQLVVAIALFLLATQQPTVVSAGWLVVTLIVGIGTLTAWAASTGADLGAITSFVTSEGLGFIAPAAGATALGVWWRARSRRVAQVRYEAEAATREYEVRLEKARNAERARIAQELHDVAGQHLSGLIALADAAVAIGPKRPGDALQLVEDVRAEGRFAAASVYSALSDLRAVGGIPMGATRDLRQTQDLIDYWNRRDMTASLHVTGDLTDLPAVISTSVFRGVQEALTNASKHAPGASVDVAIVWSSNWLQVVIENGPPRSEYAAAEPIGLGWGLDGLRDRITMMSGSVTAGPTDRGGWKVRIRIPAPEPDPRDVR